MDLRERLRRRRVIGGQGHRIGRRRSRNDAEGGTTDRIVRALSPGRCRDSIRLDSRGNHEQMGTLRIYLDRGGKMPKLQEPDHWENAHRTESGVTWSRVRLLIRGSVSRILDSALIVMKKGYP